MMRQRPDLGERAFRALIRLYPRAFRERFGEEMVDFFHARRLEQRQRGATGVRLWTHLVADVALSAPMQHVRALTRSQVVERDIAWSAPGYPPEISQMERLMQDIRYAARTLVRRPAFTVVAALTLALGIGANTAIYSVVDAVLMKPLPWPDGDRLMAVSGTRNGQPSGVVYLDFKDWRAQTTSFQELGAFRGQSVNLTGVETPDRLTGSFVNGAFLRIAGASVSQGRLMSDQEADVDTKQPVALITDAVWRTRFGSRPDVVGRKMVINGQPLEIIGVLRSDFQSPMFTPDVLLPLGYYPNAGDLTTRGRPGIAVLGKLKPGVTVAQAQRDMDVIATRLAGEFPQTNGGAGISVQSLREQIVGPSRMPLTIVLASVGVVLLIACANVANLQLARAASRGRELSMRAALGAGRSRLMRQLLTESLALSLLGGVAGLGIAYLGTQWFAAVVPTVLTAVGPITMNPMVLLFAAAITIATGVLFGVAPAWRASRAQGNELLAVRGASGGVRLRAHQTLVIAQMSLCVVLMVSAGLLTRSLIALAAAQPGFDADGVLTLQFRLPNTKYDSEARIADMFARAIAEVRGVPGVQHAALVRATPLNGNGETPSYQVDGTGETDPAKLPQAHRNMITSDYFETMRLPRVAGRDFDANDKLGGMPVAIVNEQLAKRIDPSGAGRVIGRRIRTMEGGDNPPWATIVGVVGNAKHFQVNEQQLDQIYYPTLQRPLIFTEMVVRTVGEPMLVANAVRAAILRVDRDQPVWRIRSLQTSIDNQLGPRKFQMRLLGGFAVIAVVLALIGVYGVMSYGVASRTQEMGIRVALGAQDTQVVGLVLRQGMRSIGIALVLGLVGAAFATRALETQLFGVGATDPLTFALVPLALGLVALVACYLPARRASRVDPLVALRSD
jgi:putative ABC transport system permease protein